MLDPDSLLEIAAEAARWRDLPGISAAFCVGEDVRTAAWGVLNLATRVPVTEHAVFQIGSITKPFTATLAMQLVEDGLLDLDAPVGAYLPELRIAHAPPSDAITVRTLLSHTSGILGDFFVDSGRNDDATERYVALCAELTILTPPGRFSYCNSGFAILGRIVEVLTGQTYARALEARLLSPLGITALLDPEDTMLFAAAAGHVLDASGTFGLTPTPFLPRGTEAAGARLTMSPQALLAFARLHLHGGLADDGSRLLTQRSVDLMQERQIDVPIAHYQPSGYGLSWALHDGAAPRAFGHNGATIGQAAFLRIFPDLDCALAVCVNASTGGAAEAFEEIAAAVLSSLGVPSLPAKPAPDPTVAIDGPALAGIYDTYMERITVTNDGGTLAATAVRHNNEHLAPLPARRLTLAPVSPHVFLVSDAVDRGAALCGFTDFTNGVPHFCFWGGRLAERRR